MSFREHVWRQKNNPQSGDEKFYDHVTEHISHEQQGTLKKPYPATSLSLISPNPLEPSAVAHGIRDQRVISPLPEGTIRKKDPCFSGLEGSSCKKHKSYGGGDTPQLLPQEVRGRMTLIANAFSILALCKTKMAAQQRRGTH
ncbi:uncharacterized protein LOC144303948 isoform X2 [Canis aureus]